MVNIKIRLLIFFALEDGEALYSQQKKKKKDWYLTVALVMNSLLQNSDLKKVGKTIRLFRYDLNQTPHDYIVEVTSSSKGLDLIDRVPEELWMEVPDIVQEAVIKTIPKKKNRKKTKWLSEEALQMANQRREAKGKGEKERFECRVPKKARRDKKAFLSDQGEEIEENNSMGTT